MSTPTRPVDDERLAAAYHRYKVKPKEGTIADAILVHAEACELVSFLFNVDPDRVAQAVVEGKASGASRPRAPRPS